MLKQPQATMDNLPEDLKMAILLRLPVKSLLRLKCVSKSWFSLISNPNFAKLHFRGTSQRSHRFLYTTASEIRSIDIDTPLHRDSTTVSLDFPLNQPRTHFHILGSCRGLLLVLTKQQNLLLWNPSTGFHKHISQPLVSKFVVPCGLCYDESTDDYLLLLASRISDIISSFYVFSLRTNSGQRLDLDKEFISYLPIRGSSVFNGAFHLLVWLRGAPSTAKIIIAVDIATKNLREVPTPPNDVNYTTFGDLGVLGGCLSLTEYKGDDEIRIWMMGEYGLKSSWSKFMSVNRQITRDRMISHDILPLCFTKDGELVAVDSHVTLSKWSDKGELLEHHEIFVHPRTQFWRPMILYTETLLSFP
ncbi:F-box/kelch-repeat protein At3g06240-like [Prosopis cineraria]|uniref:F-box/kelch-repeat protein At3g06240-like n=1 Tax=Prosopis cineraria TaxID=364024 RepID=UPI00241019A5|nr:F-box/kelch-repeat protein At3g06240-like [Prosopis cineraria]